MHHTYAHIYLDLCTSAHTHTIRENMHEGQYCTALVYTQSSFQHAEPNTDPVSDPYDPIRRM
jgi:hypothetical protein